MNDIYITWSTPELLVDSTTMTVVCRGKSHVIEQKNRVSGHHQASVYFSLIQIMYRMKI